MLGNSLKIRKYNDLHLSLALHRFKLLTMMVSWKTEYLNKKNFSIIRKKFSFSFFPLEYCKIHVSFLKMYVLTVFLLNLREDWSNLFLEHINSFLLLSFDGRESHLRNHETGSCHISQLTMLWLVLSETTF